MKSGHNRKYQMLKRKFDSSLNRVGLTILLLIPLVIGLQLISRWILNPYFGFGLSWTTGLSQMLLVYVTFVGAALASRDRDHVRIKFFFKYIPDTITRVLGIIQATLISIFLVAFITGSLYRYLSVSGQQYHVLPTYPLLDAGGMYLVAAIGCLLMLVYSLRNLYEAVMDYPKHLKTGGE